MNQHEIRMNFVMCYYWTLVYSIVLWFTRLWFVLKVCLICYWWLSSNCNLGPESSRTRRWLEVILIHSINIILYDIWIWPLNYFSIKVVLLSFKTNSVRIINSQKCLCHRSADMHKSCKNHLEKRNVSGNRGRLLQLENVWDWEEEQEAKFGFQCWPRRH